MGFKLKRYAFNDGDHSQIAPDNANTKTMESSVLRNKCRDNIVKLIVYYGRNDNSLDKGGVEPVEDHPGANRFSMIHVGLASSKQPAYKSIRPIMVLRGREIEIAPLLYVRRVPGNEYDVFFMWRQKSDDLLVLQKTT
ncbi:hypothetical protein CHS0354_031072 [Potamilus streckersoni]|uniref:Uncharacterized protein n=1 Tax=Potamilus streckersoni TaxID=2493646 RepID=A0AAE0RXU3_9BIVA|nr:hypothetical protein CHS0354_031072 [Potamilus streckersoni]